MNAKIGREEEYMGIIGKQSLYDETNQNGQMLTNFAATKDIHVAP